MPNRDEFRSFVALIGCTTLTLLVSRPGATTSTLAAVSRKQDTIKSAIALPIEVDISTFEKQSLKYANVSLPAGVDTSLFPQVTLLEFVRQRKTFGGSLSMPEGSPWCQGNSTLWMVGHQANETPWCYDEELGTWSERFIAVMDEKEPRNENPTIDRHGCVVLDVNRDGLPDLICSVGANYGTGNSYPELYLTQANGTLSKVLNHGLEKYITLRGRYMAVLTNSVDEGSPSHVIHAVDSRPRDDGAFNSFSLFQVQTDFPYFQEVPLQREGEGIPTHIKVADWNRDGRDDFIIFQLGMYWPMYFEQLPGGTFRRLEYPQNKYTDKMFTGEVADMNGDGIMDLVVANFKGGTKTSTLYVFLGVHATDGTSIPWDVEKEPYYTFNLPHKAPDLEIFDANEDGIPDIYVVQTNVSEGTYCGEHILEARQINRAPTFVAPVDSAHDLVFLGKVYQSGARLSERFERVEMPYEISGCGHLVEKFGDKKTLALVNSDGAHFGASAILSWGR